MKQCLELMPNSPGKLWIVLPAYNEGVALQALLQELSVLLAEVSYRIVLIDDGNTDGSVDNARSMFSTDHLIVISHAQNQGLGQAIQTAFRFVVQSANPNDMAVVMDADHTHPSALIFDLLKRLEDGYDMVIASRYQPGARVIGLSSFRIFLSVMASWLFQRCIPIPNVQDYTSGFRAYRVSLLQKADQQYGKRFITENGFTCMAEILIKLHRLGARISEIPFVLHYEQKTTPSKLKIPKTIYCSLRILLKSVFHQSL